MNEQRPVEPCQVCGKPVTMVCMRGTGVCCGKHEAIRSTWPKAVEPPRERHHLNGCHAETDGECHWEHCPQIRDGEPVKSNRSCPLEDWSPPNSV